jgi:hypothetical protein
MYQHLSSFQLDLLFLYPTIYSLKSWTLTDGATSIVCFLNLRLRMMAEKSKRQLPSLAGKLPGVHVRKKRIQVGQVKLRDEGNTAIL